MNGVLRWEEPEPSVFGRPRGTTKPKSDPLVQAAEELKARPGEWGVVYEGNGGRASGLASTIKQALAPTWRPVGHFDATARKCGDRTVTYARYVGGAS